MRLAVFTGLLLAVGACAPPDPVRSIDILFPTPDTESLPIDDGGVLRTLVVVDVDGFEVRPEGSADPLSDTEGHWHIYVNNNYRGAVSDGFTTQVEESGIVPGQQMSITVALARDNHDEVEDELGPIDSTIEFVAEGPVSTQ